MIGSKGLYRPLSPSREASLVFLKIKYHCNQILIRVSLCPLKVRKTTFNHQYKKHLIANFAVEPLYLLSRDMLPDYSMLDIIVWKGTPLRLLPWDIFFYSSGSVIFLRRPSKISRLIVGLFTYQPQKITLWARMLSKSSYLPKGQLIIGCQYPNEKNLRLNSLWEGTDILRHEARNR